MSFCAHVEGQIITDRTDQTENSFTVGARSLQIEPGMQLEYDVPNGSFDFASVRSIVDPTSVFRFVMTKGGELRLLSQFEDIKFERTQGTGISDLEKATKIQLLQKDATNIGFLPHLIVLTGTSIVSGDDYGTINKLSLSYSLSEDVGIVHTLGFDYISDSSNGDFAYSVAIGTRISNKVGVYVEPYGVLHEFEKGILNCDAGVTYLLNSNFQFYFSFGTGIPPNMNYIALGYS